MWHIHKQQLLNLSDKSQIGKEKKPQDAAAIQFPVDAALFYLTQHFRASDNKPEP